MACVPVEEYEAAWCSPIKLAVLGGARQEDRERLAAFMAMIPYIPVDETIWDLALRNAWRMSEGRQTVPWNDLLIASVSLKNGCRVFARDRHFDLMKTVLGVRLYEPGYGGSFAPDQPG
jgi:predicted nucleic acid-binding protein